MPHRKGHRKPMGRQETSQCCRRALSACYSTSHSYPLQDEIEQVILVGGATRVPKVQEVLLKAVGK